MQDERDFWTTFEEVRHASACKAIEDYIVFACTDV
jgi:hypothetical protein